MSGAFAMQRLEVRSSSVPYTHNKTTNMLLDRNVIACILKNIFRLLR